jgi:alpha-tubulin suppressor-like RCC1 family protein
MAGQFLSPDGDLESAFVSDPAIIDQFAKTGSLWGWGHGTLGELGDNTSVSKSSPVQTISGGTNWKIIACGRYASGGIKTDGTLWTWGYNDYGGQLGLGDMTGRSSPTQVGSATTWTLIDSGTYMMAGIKTDGTLWTWGNNLQGQLGDNTTTKRSSPVQILGGGNTWKQVSCYDGMAAIKTDGTLWSWGMNQYGELGNNTSGGGGTSTSTSSPVQTVSAGTNWKFVSRGQVMAGAIKTDGTLWLWGRNNYGQLGDNTTDDKSSPVQTVAGGTNWKYIVCGQLMSAAIKTDGTLWTWGINFQGQLGIGTSGAGTHKSSPVQTVAGGSNWKMVDCRENSAAAIKTDGTLCTWGSNDYGELGDGTTTYRSSPVQIRGNNWKIVNAGRYYMAAVHFYDAGNLYP